MGLFMGLLMGLSAFINPFKQRPKRNCEKSSGINCWRGTAVFFNLTFDALDACPRLLNEINSM